ncbi:hypothetical protein D9M68_916930 [compost metagenome]
MTGAGQPAIYHLAYGVVPGGDVLADLPADVARQFSPITRHTAIAVPVIEEVVIGHGPGMGLGRRRQRGVPGQRRRGGKGLLAALAWLRAGAVDHLE